MTTASNLSGPSAGLPTLRRVPLMQPISWLGKGWEDLIHHPAASLAYGLIVSVLGALILNVGRHPYLHAAAISSFLLVGPIMATGLCELSRRRTRDEAANFDSSLQPLTVHRRSLLHYGGILLLISLLWFFLSSLLLYLAFGTVGPNYFDTMWGDVLANLSAAQIVAYLAIGGILACVVFALSIVTVPMIIDRDSDAVTAMRTSLRAALDADLPVMIVWGGLCVVLVGFGFATFLVGMVLVFPLLGHATWHAYLDLVPPPDSADRTEAHEA